MQRALERKVRSAKRKYLAESAAGVDASCSAVQLKAARQQLSKFIRTTGGRADSSRTSVAGFGRSAASKANWTSIPIAGGSSTQTKYRTLTGVWSIDRHLSAVNPGFKSGDPRYRQNCQRCVPAYIMRLRGYDVIAKPAIVTAEGKISPKDPLGTNWHKIFKKMSRSHCVGSDGGLAEILLQFSKWQNGAVAEVYIELKSGGGHVFVAQKNNGVVRFIDPQTGDGDCSRYFTEARVGATIVARVDTLQPSELIEECIKNRGGKS